MNATAEKLKPSRGGKDKNGSKPPVKLLDESQGLLWKNDKLLACANEVAELRIKRSSISERLKELTGEMMDEMEANGRNSYVAELKDGEKLHFEVYSAMRSKKVVKK